MSDELFYLHGESEDEGIEIIRGEYEEELSDRVQLHIRQEHSKTAHLRKRPVTILGFGVDHGLGAHAGNGGDWRTTVVAAIRFDYLKDNPTGYIRFEGSEATELLAQLAEAVAITLRRIDD